MLPKQVAILIDRAVVSAGEEFVIQVMENTKVKLIGENTGVVIDYQSIGIVAIRRCASLSLYPGYPTSAASDRLPSGGVNATGIPPNTRFDPGVKDRIALITEYFARRARTQRAGHSLSI